MPYMKISDYPILVELIHDEEPIGQYFDEQELKFLYDEEDTYKAAMERREKKQKEARMQLMGGGG